MLRRIHMCRHDNTEARVDKATELFLAVHEAVEAGGQVGLVVEFAPGASRGDVFDVLSKVVLSAPGVTAVRVGSLAVSEAGRQPHPAE